ncbi:unnamed protein product [Rotaria socialis]|uniref:Amidohydrolase n=1 Tax=Rotaria socialis TaxID=392032 RepID=A0A820YDZ8_9BILA|nr:unnamed protein product [Rotaria socialis]
MDKRLAMDLQEMQHELIAIRHDIHANPELSMQEARTSKLVARKLKQYEFIVTEEVGRYGVVGTLESVPPGDRSIALRADMDTLKLVEESNVSYTSTVPEVMHAYGHDGHTAMLLDAAKYLSNHRNSFFGTVYFIFQPGEEKLEGAVAMMNDQLFERFPFDVIDGLHNSSGKPIGTFNIRFGLMMGASDRFLVTFQGTDGHGGTYSHLAMDVTVLQAQFILALQTIVSRNISPNNAAVISVGAIQGGSFNSLNVMPSEIRIGGITRSFTKLNIIDWGAALVNHDEETARLVTAAESLVGKEHVNANATPFTSGEVFA